MGQHMATVGPRDLVKEFEDLFNALSNKKLPEATQFLATFDTMPEQPMDIDSICHLLKDNFDFELWRAALKNPILRQEMDSPALLKMFEILFSPQNPMVSNVDFVAKRNEIILITAQNPHFCQKLSYSSFLAFLPANQELADFIATSPGFLRFLEPFFIKKLIELIPNHTATILRTLLSFQASSKPLDLLWLNETLRYLAVKSQQARRVVHEDSSLTGLSQLLVAARAQDPSFNKEMEEAEGLPLMSPLQALHAAIKEINQAEEGNVVEDEGEDDSAIIQHLRDSMSNLHVDAELSQPQAEQEEPEKNQRGMRRSKSFYFKP